jgi:hypothetical protein
MGKTGSKANKKRSLFEVYEGLFLDFVLFFLICFAIGMAFMIMTRWNWMMFLFIAVILGALSAYSKNEEQIKAWYKENKYGACPKCAYKNRRGAYFCSKCGAMLGAYMESTVLVYTGTEPMAYFVLEAVRDSGIRAWLNMMQHQSGVPAGVFVFGQDAEEARREVKRAAG